MLTALDETLMHQLPVPFAQTVISDHRFFDRMWLGGHCRENIRFLMGMANYKNTNSCDGYFTVLIGDRQYNLRAARPLLPNADEMTVGPITLEILKPLHDIRLIVEEGPGQPLAADLIFRATAPVHLEQPHITRRDGRLTQDYMRFDQHGLIEGWLSVEGRRIAADGWFGARDHSWGVRPSTGGYEPTTAIIEDDSFGGQLSGVNDGWLAIYMFFETPDYAGYIQRQENAAGNILYQDGDIARHGEPEKRIIAMEHALEFVPGTRTCGKGSLRCTLQGGDIVTVSFDSLLPGTVYKGTGYDNGFDDERGLGFHRGNIVEYDVYDVSDVEKVGLPDGRIIRPWHRELPCTVEVNGQSGMGYATVLNNGSIARYGLTGEFTNRRPSVTATT